eukprot:TRINITY_DN1149_c0_g1_i1.p1 TRINITY_DN1149_c0_g1~~TRINITY_DN1149_c0_g1_i1.p1  ORF type:complete len:425 (-),score=82.62 TRINITY_DN1149_c0_g1_i1:116-1390(-)
MATKEKDPKKTTAPSTTTSKTSIPKPIEQKELPVIKFKSFLHNTIYDVVRSRGWKETDSDSDFDFIWADKEWIRECMDVVHLKEHQRVNHFRNFYELTRKDLLIKNLKRTRKQLERDDRLAEASHYDFFPTTYNLPAEYSLFIEEFKKLPGAFWIMKPIAKSQGKGIFLFNKVAQIQDWKNSYRWKITSATGSTVDPSEKVEKAEQYIVQKYVENPYLIGGKKFDLRIYALVLSYSPLVVYLYRTAFARFSHHRFSMQAKDMSNTYIHVTNVAVQKTSENYNPQSGCKWDIRNLKMFLTSRHGTEAIDQLMMDIQGIIVNSLLAVQKVMIQDKHCFELYGYDILIDDTLKPWVLEVNSSPSLTAENPLDYQLKWVLLHDTLNIIDMEHKLEKLEDHMGGFDLIHSAGKSTPVSYLGCFNPSLRR